MTNEENIELCRAYQKALADGDTASGRDLAEKIVEGNKGLAVKLAKRFARPQSKADQDDAEQAAMMGVLRAARDFNPELGTFSTHAGSHIRDYVQRWSGKTVAVARPRSANMPASIARAAQRFRQMHGREPTAADLGITESQLAEWSTGTHFVELDNSDDEKPRVELTYDDKEAEHAAQCMRVEEAWKVALEELSPRNKDIAEGIFLKGEQAIDVAARHGLTHGRVVQICKRIEHRLKRAIDPSYEPDNDWERESAMRTARWRAARRASSEAPQSA